MGHTQPSDLIQSLTEVLKNWDYVNKMVQVSMDGHSRTVITTMDVFPYEKIGGMRGLSVLR